MNRFNELIQDYNQIPLEIIDKLNKLDATTFNHSIRVCELCKEVEKELNLPNTKLSLAGLVHDIGKFYISSRILDKPDAFDDLERNIINIHAYISYLLLKNNKVEDEICQLALFHHRLDPFVFDQQVLSCQDDSIAEKAIMLKTVDVYEALTTDRPYHRRRTKAEAQEIIRGMPEYNDDVLRIILNSNI